jgi:hypothetical protein
MSRSIAAPGDLDDPLIGDSERAKVRFRIVERWTNLP